MTLIKCVDDPPPGLLLLARLGLADGGPDSRNPEQGAVSPGDVQDLLYSAERRLRIMRRTNVLAQSGDRRGLSNELGLSAAQVEKLLAPKNWGGVGVSPTKIARLEERVRALRLLCRASQTD